MPTHAAAQPAPSHVLIVEPDLAARRAFGQALNAGGYAAKAVDSGKAAIRHLLRSRFEAVVAGMFLPDMSGLALLNQARRAVPEIPVVMAVPFGSIPIARRALAAGAAGFITQPCGAYDLALELDRILGRSGGAERTRHTGSADTDSAESALDALLSAMQSRSASLHGNAERVAAYALQLASRMHLPAEETHDLERGALLNGIGLLAVPDRILLKPGPLTEREWLEVKAHPTVGFRMCAPVASLQGAAQIVLHHHERWDGSGYPDGLAGERIPLGARIFAVANAFDAMTSERAYRPACSSEEAAEEIRRCAGTQFDPAIVQVFLATPPFRWRQIRDLFAD